MVGKMSLHQEALLGVTGQTLVHMCTDSRPQSVVSVTVHDMQSDDALIEFTAPGPGIDPLSTVTTAEAGEACADPRKVTLSDVTGVIAGRAYQLQSPHGDTEWVVAASVKSKTVTLRHPLHNVFPPGSTFRSTWIYATIPDAWAANQSNLTEPTRRNGYRVRWVYLDDAGWGRVAQSTFSLVRYETRNHVLPVHVDARHPGWLERLPTDYQGNQGKELIDQAFEAVRLDLLQEGHIDHASRNPAILSELIIQKTIEIATEVNVRNGGASPESLLVARQGYSERIARLVRQQELDTQASTGGASGDGRRKNIFSR